MFDALSERFDVAVHHRCRAATAEFVPNAVDVQPIVGHDFAARDLGSDAIDENFPAAAGQAAEARCLQSLKHAFQR